MSITLSSWIASFWVC